VKAKAEVVNKAKAFLDKQAKVRDSCSPAVDRCLTGR
jgi:hypothetical protein